ncbi:hypothetical protein [Piscinibacter sp. XHJ-5]|uniref:hypothetical protein n=1 Tax=Piscinibacter sp. XHJ-5 TaxID=3037797 RepID=UPI002452D357|nr:hypothetical protein [Piscinibacter sp. XHJ-5]
MDMSDIKRGTPASQGAAADNFDGERWRDLVSTVGSEIALPLTSALERIEALTCSGRIDKAGLRALREEVEAARRASMLAQQLTRFASARLRQSHERLTLADTLKTVLRHRARETEARGITLKPALKPADVIVDASLLFSLLNSVLDWSLLHARSEIAFAVDLKAWPAHARLNCHFAYRPADEPAFVATAEPQLDSLVWRLIEQTAWTMGLPLTRTVGQGQVRLVIEFPRTADDSMEGMSTIELDQGFGLSSNSTSLAGSHVLVIASRREMRVRLRDSIRHMGLIIDLVASVDEAKDFCREGLPHAIIVEGILNGEKLRQLRSQIGSELPEFPFIEIIEEGSSFAMSGFDGAPMGRVGRDAIESALPSVLMFELSRAL